MKSYHVRYLLSVLGLLLMTASLYGQTLQITGTVSNENNETLPGVNVVVKGTTKGTATDIDGFYSIEGKTGDTLVFTFIGFVDKEVAVSGNILNVQLSSGSITLDEFVAIGYGSVRRKDITSSITSVKGDEISKLPAKGNFTSSLQGLAAGVQVFNTQGSPGVSFTDEC